MAVGDRAAQPLVLVAVGEGAHGLPGDVGISGWSAVTRPSGQARPVPGVAGERRGVRSDVQVLAVAQHQPGRYVAVEQHRGHGAVLGPQLLVQRPSGPPALSAAVQAVQSVRSMPAGGSRAAERGRSFVCSGVLASRVTPGSRSQRCADSASRVIRTSRLEARSRASQPRSARRRAGRGRARSSSTG